MLLRLIRAELVQALHQEVWGSPRRTDILRHIHKLTWHIFLLESKEAPDYARSHSNLVFSRLVLLGPGRLHKEER